MNILSVGKNDSRIRVVIVTKQEQEGVAIFRCEPHTGPLTAVERVLDIQFDQQGDILRRRRPGSTQPEDRCNQNPVQKSHV